MNYDNKALNDYFSSHISARSRRNLRAQVQNNKSGPGRPVQAPPVILAPSASGKSFLSAADACFDWETVFLLIFLLMKCKYADC